MISEKTVPIYVRIPDEYGAMLTRAISLGNEQYQILPTPDYNADLEDWEFPPGTIVRCEWTSKGWQEPLFLAVERVG
jgi:hypothetical protein